MSDVDELLDVVDSVVAALRRHEIPYFITGSFASSVHGEFRATNDIDIVADLVLLRLDAWLTDLSATFLTDLSQARTALSQTTSFNLIHSTTFLKVDIFPCESEFNREATRRALTIALPGARETLRVSTVEDVILSKLWWFRLGGETSEIQQRDVRRLVELNRGALQLPHLKKWSHTLQVADLLERFLT